MIAPKSEKRYDSSHALVSLGCNRDDMLGGDAG